ncbi:MAG: excinuclease ABC subunit UvrC [Brevinematia bacterium]
MDREFLRKIPELPGIYIMYSKTGDVLYIGKSINLKKRVSSYFSSKDHPKKTRELVNKVDKIDYIVVNNETEALILEANLIKRYRPRYNILMKDSKFYPFVKVSRDEIPYIIATRKYEPSSSFEYFGPFTNNKLPYDIVEVIQRVFKIRTCRIMPKKACLNYYLDLCSGPCIGRISRDEYMKNVENAKKVLRGEIGEVLELLTSEMKNEAKNLNFEKASFLRDSIKVLEEIKSQEQYVFDTTSDRTVDYISYSLNENFINFYVAHIVNGRFIGKESITISRDEEKPLEKFLSSVYLIDSYIVPKKIFVDKDIIEDAKVFFDKVSLDVELEIPSFERDINIMELCRKNSNIVLADHTSRIRMIDEEMDELCEIVGVEGISVIDGFDITNYADEMAFGSSVRFIDGIPVKRYYRIFKIKSIQGQNDFEMMEEIVYRRYKREKENDRLPDLVLIDGGRGQLNFAIRALKNLGLDIPIIALAKQEEKIVFPDGKELILPRNSYALRLLQRIRDEAHRFGNTFIRNIKSKSFMK